MTTPKARAQEALDAADFDEWVECYNCGGEGYSGHDCGEDTCCCLDPEDNVRCDICEGAGGWNRVEALEKHAAAVKRGEA